MSSKETKEVLLETVWKEDLAFKKQYTNPDSICCKELYNVLSMVSGEVDINPFLKRYEKITGYSFKLSLLEII
ncbi:MAG: hypothetical protein ACOCZQ_03260 [Nanoarchaeota archaeon]